MGGPSERLHSSDPRYDVVHSQRQVCTLSSLTLTFIHNHFQRRTILLQGRASRGDDQPSLHARCSRQQIKIGNVWRTDGGDDRPLQGSCKDIAGLSRSL